MKIIYDYDIFTRQRFGGISRYFYELITGLIEYKDTEISLFLGLNNSGYDFSSNGSKINIKGRRLSGADKLHFLFNPLNKISYANFIKKNRFDLVHNTYYPGTVNKESSKIIITIHDMTHELFPKYFAKSDNTSHLKKLSIQSSDGIICVSETTKNDLMNIYDVDESKIRVIYHGVTMDKKENVPAIINKPYILYIGQRWGYKNFNLLLTAYSLSPEIKNNFKLICFGGGDFNYSEKIYIKDSNLSEYIEYIDGSDDVLNSLYTNASIFVYTSLYEGFGFPPIEAMICGCPVLASSTSAVKEIAGNAAIYFDPASLEELIIKLELILRDNTLREKLINLGYSRSKLFSWNKSVSEHYKYYNKLINK